MTPEKPDNHPQLFRNSLDAMLNDKHPLYQLANTIDWQQIEQELSPCYSPDMGRPGNATRLMVGLHYLKHAYNESDESIIERWVENPYWQYFCGYEYMQHEFPIHPTSMVKWRHRVGAKRMEILLRETLSTAKRQKHLQPEQASKIIVDTTVQEKAIAYPTDAGLYCKAIRRKLKRRSAIEPTIGHLKTENRMGRNFLKGVEDDGLNDRQRRILEEIDGGAELRQKDVIAMFRRHWNPSTVKRDIKGLRDAGLIETHADGYYIRTRG